MLTRRAGAVWLALCWAVCGALAPASAQTEIPASKVKISALGKTLEQAAAAGQIAQPCTIAAGSLRVITEGGACGQAVNGALITLTDATSKIDCGTNGNPAGSAGGGSVPNVCQYRSSTGKLEPFGGGGAGSQTPIIGDVDADGHLFGDLGNLSFLAETDSGSHVITWTDAAGIPFRFGFLGAARESFSSAARDNLFQVSHNFNLGQTNLDSFFRPAWKKVVELGFHAGTGTSSDSTIEDYTDIQRSQSIIEYNGATGATPIVGDVVNVRQNGGGSILANGVIGAMQTAPTRMTVYWFDKVGATDPQAGDDIELPSATTVTSVSGTFDTTNHIKIYPGGTCTGTPAAFAYAASVNVPGGGSQVIRILETQGPSTALVTGKCINQADSGASGITGTFAAAGTQNAVSFASSATSWRQSHVNTYTTKLEASYNWQLSKTLFDLGSGVAAFASGVTGPTNKLGWVRILSSTGVSDAATDGYLVHIGDANFYPANVDIAGKLMLHNFSPGGASEIRSWGGSGTRYFDLPDMNAGTGVAVLAGFSETDAGCSDGDVILQSGTGVTGFVKCGNPPGGGGGAGDMASTGASVVGGIPTATDTTGDALTYSGVIVAESGSGFGAYISGHEDTAGGTNVGTLFLGGPVGGLGASRSWVLPNANGIVPVFQSSILPGADNLLLVTVGVQGAIEAAAVGNTLNPATGVMELSGSLTAPVVVASTTARIPSGADPSSACTLGDVYMDTDTASDTSCTTGFNGALCRCSVTGAPGTWVGETTQ